MKIRSGFVSNSSSQSFVIRGIKLNAVQLAKMLGVDTKELRGEENESELYEELYNIISEKFGEKFSIEATGNYFGDRNYNTVIIGYDMGGLEDGEVTEFDDLTKNDDVIVKKFLKNKMEVDPKDLKLFVQYISNDNF